MPINKITPQLLGSFTVEETWKISGALTFFQQVIDDPEFFDVIATYKNRHGKNEFTSTPNTPAFIANTLWFSLQNPDLKITMYKTWNPWSSTVAYHEGGIIHLNRWIFTKNSVAQVAGSIMHEFCHVLGMEHTFKDNLDRPDSAPYAIGRLVARWGKV